MSVRISPFLNHHQISPFFLNFFFPFHFSFNCNSTTMGTVTTECATRIRGKNWTNDDCDKLIDAYQFVMSKKAGYIKRS
jgi:hypothetical protein